MTPGRAEFGDRVATGVLDVTSDPAKLERAGFWAVVVTFEGELTAVRMAHVEHRVRPAAAPLQAVADYLDGWESSLTEEAYLEGVSRIRRSIAAGETYQVNLCRVLSRRISESFDLDRLNDVLQQSNPAPYAARIDVPAARLDVVCASPELFLERAGDRLVSGPIKGTAPTADQMLEKDRTENIMITDLVRNDLSAVSLPGSVDVEQLCAEEAHPGVVHLVSTIASRLRPQTGWHDILAATYPPGSVSGAPKSSALEAIRSLEPVRRGPYCGAIGWVDSDAGEARLAVGIRTFWAERDAGGQRLLRFGTGAGITWGSDPSSEWAETELKARRLISLAGHALGPSDAAV
nr:chorismate-binding protein [Demetria terragena]